MIQETALKFFTNNINRKDAGIDVFIETGIFYKHAEMKVYFLMILPNHQVLVQQSSPNLILQRSRF